MDPAVAAGSPRASLTPAQTLPGVRLAGPRYGPTVRGTRGYEVPGADWGGVTQTADALYVHILDWPDGPVRIPAHPRWTGTSDILTRRSAVSAVSVRDGIDTIVRLNLST